MAKTSDLLEAYASSMVGHWKKKKRSTSDIVAVGENIRSSMETVHDFIKEIMTIEEIPILLQLQNQFQTEWKPWTDDLTPYYKALFIFKSYANLIELFFAQIYMYGVDSKVETTDVLRYDNIKKMRDVSSKINAGIISVKFNEDMLDFALRGVRDWMVAVANYVEELEKNKEKLTPPENVVSELLRIYEESRGKGR
ncbi:MAG: hypothetical protein ABH829_02280 [archaeon]